MGGQAHAGETVEIHPFVVRSIARVGPVVEQDAEVHERIAERRLVPVEDGVHPIRIGLPRLLLLVASDPPDPEPEHGPGDAPSQGHSGDPLRPTGGRKPVLQLLELGVQAFPRGLDLPYRFS